MNTRQAQFHRESESTRQLGLLPGKRKTLVYVNKHEVSSLACKRTRKTCGWWAREGCGGSTLLTSAAHNHGYQSHHELTQMSRCTKKFY